MDVFSWGANSHGQLGQGILSEQFNTPQVIKQVWNVPIRQISCGGGHTLLLDEEGEVFACGWNQQKQLGFENKNSEETKLTVFTKIWNLSGKSFRSLCAGWDSSAGITEKNTLFLWGSNSYGQLGLPREHFPKCMKPFQLELKVKSVSMGLRHTILVDVNGCVWSTGCGKRGQLGLGEETTSSDTFQKLKNVCNINSAQCGQYHSIAWSKIDSAVYVWGDNTHGQVGLGPGTKKVTTPAVSTMLQDLTDQIVSIHCGWTHSAVLLKNGNAVYWGRNNYGQLGCTQTSHSNFHILSINGIPIRELSMGSEHTICILENNSVYSWGWNEHGNTGTGNTQNITEPQPVKINRLENKKCCLYSGTACNFLVVSSI